MSDTRRTRTFGDNNPIHSHPAAWDGHRSVRLMGENFNLGLATTAYSYALSYDELTEVAERIALLWNLHLGVSNDDLRNPPPETNVTGALLSPQINMAIDGNAVTLAACPAGPFLFNGSLGFKTEYGAISGKDLGGGLVQWTMVGGPDVYCMGSGEAFWGGVTNREDRAALLVNPVEFCFADSTVPQTEAAGSRPMDEASLPNTSRLSQLEARTSCAASVNDQLTPPSPQPQNRLHVATPELAGIELVGVAEQLEQGAGAWRACSGCQELIEGHPTGPWSETLKSYMGGGCRECGGIGAIWDNTDYSQVNDPAPIAKREAP